MKNSLPSFIFALVCIIILTSCQKAANEAPAQIDTLKLTLVDPNKAAILSDSVSVEVDTANTKGIFGGKGKLWKLWEKLHKNCQNSDMTRGMTYLGVSNNMSVGSIIMYDKNKKTYFASYPLLYDKFSNDQQKELFAKGTPAKCNYAVKTTLSVEFLIKSKIVETGNADLDAKIQSARTVDSNIESWQQDNLYIDRFRLAMNRRNDEYAKDYLETSKLPGRYIIGTAIQVNGFSATINTTTKIEGDLKVELEKGISEKIGETEATVKFSYAGERTIKVTTIGTFVVFGTLYQNQ